MPGVRVCVWPLDVYHWVEQGMPAAAFQDKHVRCIVVCVTDVTTNATLLLFPVPLEAKPRAGFLGNKVSTNMKSINTHTIYILLYQHISWRSISCVDAWRCEQGLCIMAGAQRPHRARGRGWNYYCLMHPTVRTREWNAGIKCLGKPGRGCWPCYKC